MALLLLVTLALALRLHGLTAGLPDLRSVDEPVYSGAVSRLDWDQLRPEQQRAPTAYPYAILLARTMVGAWPGLPARLRELASKGRVLRADSPANVHAARDDEALHVLLGRLLAACAGTLTLLPVFALGRALGGVAAGLAGAALLAVDYLHVRQSHLGTNDTLLVLCASAAAAAALGHLLRGGRGRLLASAALAGAAAASKLTGVVALLPPLLAVRGPRFRSLGAVLAVAALTLIVLAPFLVLDMAGFRGDLAAEWAHTRRPVEGQPDTALLLYARALWVGAGPLALALALVGLAVTAADAKDAFRRRRLVVLLALPTVYVAAMSLRTTAYIRYALPLAPFLAVLAGLGIAALGRRWRAPGTAMTLLTLLAAAWPAAHSLRFDALRQRPDTRELAARWIVDHTDATDVVLLDGLSLWMPPSVFCPAPRSFHMAREFDDTRRQLQELGHPPRYLVLEDWMQDFLDPGLAPVGRDLDQARDFYAGLQRRFPVAARWGPAADGGPVPFFYEQIYAPWDHLWDLQRPGPAITIFELEDGGASPPR